ncbi:IclR family transcriptional regulator [Jiangella endophytica]|uniref:IclR family transcriptional regulator n=1 Tax=Jiangella endophytica TaxID=1623398 RepID=UPI000E346EE5|nr:IclR family transcriptional regulator [Jiangella endophytica]
MRDPGIVAGDDRPGQEGDRVVGSDRVLVVLKELAGHPGGVGLDELTRLVGSPKPTVHRALRSLRRARLAAQDARGHYLLGDEFLRLAFAHHEARPEHVRLQPVLEALAARFGETTHYAVLDGREVVYRAKVDPPSGAAVLTSTIGRRNPAHSTGVGKLLLAHRLTTPDAVAAWVGGRSLERRTERTRSTLAELQAELAAVWRRGYALDDEENEAGVACLALPVYALAPGTPSGALSVSALTYRTPLATLVEAVDEIRGVLGRLGESG